MRVLGIDYGGRRIGIAASDATGMLARPVGTLEGTANHAVAVTRVLDEVARLEADGDPIGAIVLGLPRRLDGSPNDQTPIVEAFAARLRAACGRPLVLQDERLTSHEADGLLAIRERDWRVRKKKLDAVAAAVILQEYLDAQGPHGA
jgi:putative Holliday junction resolvase